MRQDEARSRVAGSRSACGCECGRPAAAARRAPRPPVSAAYANSSWPVRPVACSSVLSGPPPWSPSKSIQSPARSPLSAMTQEPLLARRVALDVGEPPFVADAPAVREEPRHPGLRRVAQARDDRRRGRNARALGRSGATSLRSIMRAQQDHQPALGAGDRGVEPAGAVLGGAAEPVVVDDDVLPLRALRLVAGDGVAPDASRSGPACPASRAGRARGRARRGRRSGPCRSRLPAGRPPIAVLGPDAAPRSRARSRRAMSSSSTNMPLTRPRSFRFFRQMIFSPRPLRVDVRAKPGGLLHGVVELQPGRVAAADHLAAAQHLLGRDVAACASSRRWRRARRKAIGSPCRAMVASRMIALSAGLAMDLGQHHVGRVAGEGAFALDRRQLAGIAQHQDRLAEGQQVARHLRRRPSRPRRAR